MELATILSYVRTCTLSVCVLFGGYLFYSYITNSFGIIEICVVPFFIAFSLVSIVIKSNRKFKNIQGALSGFVIYMSIMIPAIVIVYGYDKIRNMSPLIYSVSFFWEEGIDMEFRTNGTFKALNEDMLNSWLSYGKYKIEENHIILMDEVRFGMSTMNDTLIIHDDGIRFTLEIPWRDIDQATMTYKRDM